MKKLTTVAYVTDSKGKEDTHYVHDDDGVTLNDGSLVLTYLRNQYGAMTEGHIYAPGFWSQVNIQQEENEVPDTNS